VNSTPVVGKDNGGVRCCKFYGGLEGAVSVISTVYLDPSSHDGYECHRMQRGRMEDAVHTNELREMWYLFFTHAYYTATPSVDAASWKLPTSHGGQVAPLTKTFGRLEIAHQSRPGPLLVQCPCRLETRMFRTNVLKCTATAGSGRRK
jgi:hypothetical protein